MSREIVWQRCFKIPIDRLDLFLVKVSMASREYSCFECSYIFKYETHYDVIVEEFIKGNGQRYPFVEYEIERFAKDIWPVATTNTDQYCEHSGVKLDPK